MPYAGRNGNNRDTHHSPKWTKNKKSHNSILTLLTLLILCIIILAKGDVTMDFSKYKPTDTYYSGSEKKIGIKIDGAEYILKFRKYA